MSEEASSEKKDVLLRMMDICSRSEKCSHEIQMKLESYPLKESDKEWILERLKEEKFIDDKRYAGFFVKDKFRLNQWGKLKIRQALYSKKIEAGIIDEALQQIDEIEYEDLIIKLITNKNKEIKDRNIYQRKGKLFRFAAQRGFETEKIYHAIDRILTGDIE